MILPEDCIREILEQLSEDKRTLYSCLITNRTYCQFVVPILWRNPWPTFNSLTNELERIYWKILEIINYNNGEQLEQIFNKEFWELFIKQCKIKSLEIPNFNIFEYPESKIHLSSLSILKIFISYPKEMIIELSKNVHTLKRIEILSNVILPKLEILSLVNVKGEHLSIFTKLIENTKGSLKILYIHIQKSSPIPSSSIDYYFNIIKSTCPNIEVLPIWLISVFYLKNFEDLLISCPKIRKIIIHFKSISTSNNNFIPIDI
ncbi:hypothetical protein RhiirA4_551149, partial [Rhizophagus irregularis]